MGGAIYGAGTADLAQKFGVSEVAATVGITTFVLGYAFGPMVLSPISELAYVGRMPIYIITLALFIIVQVPTALTTNFGVVIFLRFLAGFIGSPVLATGGASLADVYKPEDCASIMGLWGVVGTGGPSLGPLLGGFAAQAKGWTWTIWILMWAAGLAFIILVFFLPETSSQTLLYRRADRLRRLTGNQNLRSQAERDGQHISVGDLAMTCLVRPIILSSREPIVIAWNLYCSLLYAILYCWIESFGVVFIEHHGFSLGENGLAFISLPVGGLVAYIVFLPYINKVLKPKFADGSFVPEDRLPITMLGGALLPISLFWFGWTSSGSIHWISPMAAASLWMVSNYLIFMSGLSYLIDCYPRHVASVLAGNVVMRSAAGAVFPLFSNAFFHHLGVGPACSVLGGIACLLLPIPFLLYRYGPKLRSWSKYAD
ncbi:MFS general substrate transporter [Irpex lacteus]|nr:MFS general substrate transporter [Irpex lacteus]